jgi:valyl-tRNA synthetase
MTILDTSLRLLHPFVPFITEELWGNLKATCKNHPANFTPKSGWRDALMISEWPESTPEVGDENGLLQNFILVMDIVRAIRNFRTEKNVKPGTKLEALITAGEKTSILSQQAGIIAALAHLDKEKISIVANSGKAENQPGMVVSGVEIFLTLEEVINKEEEQHRLELELKEVLGQVERLQTLLGSSFAERAPSAVVEKEKQKLESFRQTAEKLKQQLSILK